MKNGYLGLAFHSLVVAFMLAPLLVVCLVAFTPTDTLAVPFGDWSLRWFRAVFEHGDLVQSFWNSLAVAVFAATLAALLAVPAALAIARFEFAGRQTLNGLLMSPLIVPHLVLGPAGFVNQFFEAVGIGRVRMLYTPIAVVVALVHVMLPFMVIPVWTSLHKLDPQVENAALSLGASRATVMRRVVLPQVTPGLLSGGLIVFALSASALAIPGLLGGRRLKMVATLIYDEYLHELNWPLGAAIALALLGVNLAVMLGTNALLEGAYRKRMGI